MLLCGLPKRNACAWCSLAMMHRWSCFCLLSWGEWSWQQKLADQGVCTYVPRSFASQYPDDVKWSLAWTVLLVLWIMPSLTLFCISLVWDGGGVEWMEWHSFHQVPLPALNTPSLSFPRLHSAITCTQPLSHIHVHVSTKQSFGQIQRTKRCHRSASAVGGAAESKGLHLRQWRLLAWLDLSWGPLRPGNLLFVHMIERDCSYYIIAQPYNLG